MRNFTLMLSLAFAGLTAGAQVYAPTSPEFKTGSQAFAAKAEIQQHAKGNRAKRAPLPKRAPRFNVGAPAADLPFISETPEGTETMYQKFGRYYGYNWLMGIYSGRLDGTVCNTVISPDGKKFYMQQPVSQYSYSDETWIVGDIEGDVVTFTFPQLIFEDIYYDDEGNVEESYLDYVMKMEFEVDDEETGEGWYYPAEDQTYKMRINADGTIDSLEGDDMIGYACWIEPDPEEGETEGYWDWQISGDFIWSMSKIDDFVPNTMPDGLEIEDWQLKTDISSRRVGVSVDGDTMYITRLFNRTGMYDCPVIGKIDGDKVVFETGQYLGVYEYMSTLAFFLTGHCEIETDEYGEYKSFKIDPSMTFAYDADNKILYASESAFCISSIKDDVYYYLMADQPYICVPDMNINVESLMKPILAAYYDFDDEYDYDAEFYFDIPTLDANRNILDASRIYYEVIVNDEVYTFYNDEYVLPEGVEEMTEIPYGFDNYWEDETSWGWDFAADGTEHGFLLHARFFDSLGVRTLYKNPDGTTVYSDILWATGYQGDLSKVGLNAAEGSISAVRYYDMSGAEVRRPAKGIYARQTIYSDGTVKNDKIVVK